MPCCEAPGETREENAQAFETVKGRTFTQRDPGGTHLLLVLVLQPQPVLDAGPRLQEGPPLGALGQHPGAHPIHVHAHEKQGVGAKLEGREQGRWAGAPLGRCAGPPPLRPVVWGVIISEQDRASSAWTLPERSTGLPTSDRREREGASCRPPHKHSPPARQARGSSRKPSEQCPL